MRIVHDWQYRYIEKCLYQYNQLGELETEVKMRQAIDHARLFFAGTPPDLMITEYYFKAHTKKKHATLSSFYATVCHESLFIEQPSGYLIRREIIYRVAMNCYALGLFSLPSKDGDLIAQSC